jgi:hypothetical protein
VKKKFFECFSKFRSGVTSAENVECMECPSVSRTDENVDKVKKSVLKNRTITVHKVINMFVRHEANENVSSTCLNKCLGQHLNQTPSKYKSGVTLHELTC